MGLKKNNPGCECCESGTPCAACNATTPSSVSITISGITDGLCDCSVLNGTHILAQKQPCVFGNTLSTLDASCVVPGEGTGISYYLEVVFATYNIYFTIYYFLTGAATVFSSVAYLESMPSPGTYDCEGTTDIALWVDGDAWSLCDSYTTDPTLN